MKPKYTASTIDPPGAAELHHLFSQAHWALSRTLKDSERLLDAVDVFVTIRHAGRLIGFGRALSDGVFRALLDDIIVEQSYRGQGVGEMIVKSLVNQLSDIEEILLHAEMELEGFYSRFGFKPFHGLTMHLRKDWRQ